MNSKIEKSFRNSQFYRNYNETNYVLLKFQTIKNEYTESENKYKNKSNNALLSLNNKKMQNKILEKTNLFFSTTLI